MEGEWLERNKSRAYPFTDAADLTLSAPYQANDPRPFFLDAYLTFRSDNADEDHDYHWRFVSLDPASSWDLVLYNTETGALLDVTPTSNSVIGDYRVLVYTDEDEGLALTLVLNHDYSPLSTASSPIEFSSPYPEFVPRCIGRQPARVNSIGLTAGTWVNLGEIGELIEGTNIQLEVDPSTPLTTARDLTKSVLRPDVRRIKISAIPGAGTGKLETDCGGSLAEIRTINQIAGDEGNFFIAGDDCYRIHRRIVGNEPRPFVIKIHNDCRACCQCDDFSELLEHIRQLKDEGLAIKDIWADVLAAYETTKAEWDLRVACVGEGCVSQLFGYAFTGWLVTIQVWVGNMEDCLQEGATVDISFAGGDYTFEYVPGSGMVYNTQDNYGQVDPTDNGDGTYTFVDNSAIKGGHYKLFTFSVRVSGPDRVEDANVQIDASVLACAATEPSVLQANVQLISNTNKGGS
jgi:hypothetical protein